MAIIDDFKQQKKQFKQLTSTLSDRFDEYDDQFDTGTPLAVHMCIASK